MCWESLGLSLTGNASFKGCSSNERYTKVFIWVEACPAKPLRQLAPLLVKVGKMPCSNWIKSLLNSAFIRIPSSRGNTSCIISLVLFTYSKPPLETTFIWFPLNIQRISLSAALYLRVWKSVGCSGNLLTGYVCSRMPLKVHQIVYGMLSVLISLLTFSLTLFCEIDGFSVFLSTISISVVGALGII